MTEFTAHPSLGRDPHLPGPQGLYDPSKEHDACGVGFVADMKNRRSHEIVQMGLRILENLDHRGAVGADPKLGDGCGILVQIPHTFFAEECAKLGFNLPEPGHYGIGQFFMPTETVLREKVREIVARVLEQEGLTLLGWREVPVDSSDLGEAVKEVEPAHRQLFVGRGPGVTDEDDFERKLYVARKAISNAIYQRRERALAGYYPVSMSCRTVVYKGMFLADQLGKYYPDLHDPADTDDSALAGRQIAQQIAIMLAAVGLRHEGGDVLADDLACGPAELAFRR